MRPVSIIGVGLLPVTRGAHRPASELAAEAVRQALADTGGLVGRPDALVVGNMMSGLLSDQTQLGALVADRAGFRGVEAVTVEAACASGAAAVRQGLMAVASGLHRAVVVVGVETMTHTPKERTTHALATASDWAAEGAHGETFVSLNARLMAAYMAAYGARPEDFAPLALTAHDNACDNPLAVFHKRVTLDDYLASREIVPPV
ncbi:MAG: hypothetical protein KC635_06925, partial [Myxococcales bacterium]|nr:hypothetical protein [Myxococcales bacterium]